MAFRNGKDKPSTKSTNNPRGTGEKPKKKVDHTGDPRLKKNNRKPNVTGWADDPGGEFWGKSVWALTKGKMGAITKFHPGNRTMKWKREKHASWQGLGTREKTRPSSINKSKTGDAHA